MQTRTLFAVLVFFGVMQCNAQPPKPAEVAPGITLPTDGDANVFALDITASGPVLLHITPHEVLSNSHAATNFLRAQVFAGPHAGAVVEGPHAPITLASTKAVLYVRLAGEEAEIMRTRVHLLWLQAGKKRREISDFSMNIFGGQRARNVDEVPCDMERVEGTNWYKIAPKDPLLPGEFAFAFLSKDVNQMPTVVYDFSVAGGKPSTGNPYAPKPSETTSSK